MPNWNRHERGVMSDEEKQDGSAGDYDGLSCLTVEGVVGHDGVEDVEDLTMLSGLRAMNEVGDDESEDLR